MKHTPGPWEVIAIGKRRVISSGHGWLVETPKRGEPETELQAKQLEADYGLMAAAPELLDALKAVAHWMSDAVIPCCFPRQTILDAIAKAEGTAKVE